MDVEIRFVVAVNDVAHAERLFEDLRDAVDTEIWVSEWAPLTEHAND